MKRERFLKGFRQLTAAGFCVFLALLAALNTHLVAPAIGDWIKGHSAFPAMTERVASGYLVDDFDGKFRLLELNGALARLTGRRLHNDVMLLKNGMLSWELETFQKMVDYQPLADELTRFSEYLKPMGIPFLYVQVPWKMDLDGTLLPAGLHDYPDASADALLKALEDAGISTLDLRLLMARDRQQIEAYFYKTDHHWTPDGALKAFQILMDDLKTRWNNDLDVSLTDSALWERHALEHWFLGSHGKRVGALFAGTDPLIWYTPRFDTEMSCAIPHRKEFFYGDFETVNLRQEYIDAYDYYAKNAYCVYIGGDFPLVRHRNAKAPNKQKILILKDSFVLPLQAFLSTEFAAVDVIDPRHLTDMSVAEYCEKTKPDLVIMMINVAGIDGKEYSDLGV